MKAQAIKSGKESGMPTGMKVKNPGKTLGRVLGYVFKRYAFAFVGVFLCIFISSYSSVQASAMIDDVITAVDAQLKVIAGGGTAGLFGRYESASRNGCDFCRRHGRASYLQSVDGYNLAKGVARYKG